MNYYAKGGQAQGLKALAQELPKYGRGGDTIVAHINPEEAAMLKAMGGSGTINPATGLPEFGFFSKLNPVKAISNLGDSIGISKPLTDVFQPIEKAVVQPASRGLASFDKLVGNTIPGGWGTLGMAAASFVPGMTPAMMGGLGGLTGSGVLRRGGNFNLQGALMGGAMAYGAANLSSGLQSAGGGGAEAVANAAGGTAPGAISFDPATLASTGMIESTDTAALNALSKGMESGAGAGLQVAPPPSIGSQIMSGNFGNAMNQVGQNLSGAANNALTSGRELLNKATTGQTYEDLGKGYLQNLKAAGRGITNLSGLGDGGLQGAKEAAKAFTGSGAGMSNTVVPIATGAMGLQAIEEQRNYLQDQLNAGAISQGEFNAQLAEINRQADIARKSVASSPFSTSPDTSYKRQDTLYGTPEGDDTLYTKNPSSDATLYATGGAVNAPDDQTRMLSGSPMTNFLPSSQYTASRAEEIAAMQANQAAGIQTMGGLGGLGALGGLSGLGGLTRGLPTNNPSGILSQTSAAQTMQPTAQTPYNTYSSAGYSGASGASGPSGPSGLGGAGGSSNGAFPLEGQYGIVKMAAGGMTPRFLSGGGDGMSDDIPASIEGKQEARLADGEFVIPADVVSHLGNGSSKAGAKRLYSMMDKVRHARTGNKKQGKQINPDEFLAA